MKARAPTNSGLFGPAGHAHRQTARKLGLWPFDHAAVGVHVQRGHIGFARTNGKFAALREARTPYVRRGSRENGFARFRASKERELPGSTMDLPQSRRAQTPGARGIFPLAPNILGAARARARVFLRRSNKLGWRRGIRPAAAPLGPSRKNRRRSTYYSHTFGNIVSQGFLWIKTRCWGRGASPPPLH